MIETLQPYVEQINWQEPRWFWGFVPLAVILLLLLLARNQQSRIKRMVAPHLRGVLFTASSGSAFWWPFTWFILATSCLLVALANPAVEKKDIPGGKAASALLIGVDLSQSMLSNDLSPNRLERAKIKIIDLLEADPRMDIGLFAYAGTAHLVVPFSSDKQVIKHHFESLHPSIMPVRGSSLERALSLADSLLSRRTAPSRLLLITDVIPEEEAAMLSAFAQEEHNRLSVLPLATNAGAQVPGYRKNTFLKDTQGKTVTSAANTNALSLLRANTDIHLITPTLDASDMEHLAELCRNERDFRLNDEISDDEWDRKGWYFLWPALVFMLMWFRKGWSLFWVWTLVLMLPSCAPTDEKANWWYSNNYRAQAFEEKGDYETAAQTYESLMHKGMAWYKAGNYEAALAVFEMDSSATATYNKGIVLAKMGRLQEARDAFQAAIELDPSLDQTHQALTSIEQLITQQDSIFNLMGEIKDIKDPANKTPLKERKASGEDEELSSDTEVDELPDHGDRVTDEVETGITKAEELERPPENMENLPQKDAQNVMLRKISSDPSEFLRRRFAFQKEKDFNEVKETEVIW